ncbi:hypothetical protein [Amycolatopsis sp. lyj-112]|uniref:hypothetical protein n=1 Tax=Amycolatopsis sp. lyj-112 TaxID=2789288 RepID=UPI00397DC01A
MLAEFGAVRSHIQNDENSTFTLTTVTVEGERASYRHQLDWLVARAPAWNGPRWKPRIRARDPCVAVAGGDGSPGSAVGDLRRDDLDRMGRPAIHVADAVQRRYPDRVIPPGADAASR